ncbi:maleate isomerase [Geobacillus thermodenitrificans]|jgi:maleate isomerase|uniref:maleate cis-trans isomerase family protein n=1 Tax=Geobacillus thermodenitrificans TaxID=33940 RepID=UPI002E06B2BC|nr:maleate isomerase [Geobacillus thermodenitrificans]
MRPKKRVGLIVPAGNTTIEVDFYEHLSQIATVHATRIAGPSGVESEEGMDLFNLHIERAANELARAKVDVVVYGFTTGSFYRGQQFTQELLNRISKTAGVPAVTPSSAILKALHFLNAKRIFIVTPYTVWNNTVLINYLQETDYKIVGLKGDSRNPAQAIKTPLWNQEPEEIVEHISAVDIPPKVDVLLCPCTAWRTVEVIEELEKIVKIPVITANQAVIWETALLLKNNL